MIRVLHLMSALSRGGPGNALVTLAAATAPGVNHLLVTLGPTDERMVRRARDCGLGVAKDPAPQALRSLIDQADIVQVHFWNTPALYRLLGEELPEMRLVLWAHVSGESPPQVLPPQVLAFADRAVACCEYTPTITGLEQLVCIPAVTGWDRVTDVSPGGTGQFTIGYLGKLDFSKLHPDFISLCASIDLPDARFLVCGDGGAARVLHDQAFESGLAERMEFRGFVDDVGSAFGEMDVLGYALAADTGAAAELALQEAMYAGLPPVVLGPPAVRQHIVDGQTGLVARDARDYVQAVRHLHDHPSERERIGRAAHDFAARMWSPDAVGARWTRLYQEMNERPKRRRAPLKLPDSGAARFVQTLGHGAPAFLASMIASASDAVDCDREIAQSPGILATGDGGILNYRDFYPDDPYLRLWAGLVLRRQGHPAVAAGEFAAAIRLGISDARAGRYLSAAAREARVTFSGERDSAGEDRPGEPRAQGWR